MRPAIERRPGAARGAKAPAAAAAVAPRTPAPNDPTEPAASAHLPGAPDPHIPGPTAPTDPTEPAAAARFPGAPDPHIPGPTAPTEPAAAARFPGALDPHIPGLTEPAAPARVLLAPGGPAPPRGRRRAGRLGGLGAALAATAYVGLVDPAGDGAYPLCPSQALFGIDCPACGGLRGTHDLLRGDVVEALDHNVLLPVLLGVTAVALALWLLPVVGRRAPTISPPRWALVVAALVAAAFTVLRNLPVAGLDFLASGA
jgi:hypothetical protein